MKLSIILILPFLLFANHPDSIFYNTEQTTAIDQYPWELKKDKEGVKVYLRKVEGESIREFKATVRINGSVEAAIRMLDDVEGFTDWLADVKTAKVLKKLGDFEKYFHTESSIPFPFKNRDLVLHYHAPVKRADGSVYIKMTTVPGIKSEKRGVVRIKKAWGNWVLTPTANGQTDVEYQFFADPGGALPGWIVNMGIVDNPHKSMVNMKTQVEKY